MSVKLNFLDKSSLLPESFYEFSNPDLVKAPRLLSFNSELAQFLNIDFEALGAEVTQVFSGHKLTLGSKPFAVAYAGHQFGHFNPSLGDGRAHVLGELVGKDGKAYEVQLKGSGRTKFSRSGDGKSPLGPVVREYLISEYMHACGVPTTRALSAIATGEFVNRGSQFEGGVLTRVALSLLRVGSFEYLSYINEPSGILKLINILSQKMDEDFLSDNDPVLSYFKNLLTKQAHLVAQWMSLGFVHGVMNTDNTSAVGITIDYGPCAFLEETDFSKVFSSIDSHGRYAFGRQPAIMRWNLTVMADALLSTYTESERSHKIKLYEAELENFLSTYEAKWKRILFDKLGLLGSETEDGLKILSLFLKYINTYKLDYTLSFRELNTLLLDQEVSDVYEQNKDFTEFLNLWRPLVLANFASIQDAKSFLNSKNPAYIPRNHIIEEIIADTYQGDLTKFKQFEELLKTPFVEQEGLTYFYNPAKESDRVKETFCGT